MTLLKPDPAAAETAPRPTSPPGALLDSFFHITACGSTLAREFRGALLGA